MKLLINRRALLAALLLPLAAAAPAAELEGSREDAILLTLTATVEAVDLATREVALRGPLGNLVTVTAGPAVRRLKEVKVGDQVRAEYYLSVAIEVRPPTPEEEQTPVTILEGAARAPAGAAPAGGGLRRLKVVASVDGLDRSTRTVTLAGPLGNHLTARVRDPAVLEQLQLGQKVVVTLTEALAISLDKVSRKARS